MTALASVKDIQAKLAKESSNDDDSERALDLLDRLAETPMSVDILSTTMIGKDVAKLKNHNVLGAKAKDLVKKWKLIAKQAENEDNTSSAPPERAAASTGTKKAKLDRRPSASAELEAEWADLPPLRQNVAKKLYEALLHAKPALVADGINGHAVDHLVGPRATAIEAANYRWHNDKKQYIDTARTLAFNLGKNVSLCQDVILGQVEPSTLVSMTPDELATDQVKQQKAREARKMIESKRLDWDQANEDKINKMCGIKGDLLKASLFTCSRCKSTKTTSTQKQTRSADEPMTVFVLCLNCGKRWKC